MEKLQVGDRVVWPGWESRHESNRFGSVIEVYNGTPGLNTTVEFCVVKFDDGEIKRGVLRLGGCCRRVMQVTRLLGI